MLLSLINPGRYQNTNSIARKTTGNGATDVPPKRFPNNGKLVTGKVSTIIAQATLTNPWYAFWINPYPFCSVTILQEIAKKVRSQPPSQQGSKNVARKKQAFQQYPLLHND